MFEYKPYKRSQPITPQSLDASMRAIQAATKYGENMAASI
jgi:hypothetical protein